MSTEEKNEKQHHNPLHDHELEREEVHEVVAFLRNNGMSIAIAIAIGVIASLGYIFYRNSQHQKRMYAARALANAETTEALEAITEDFKGTPSAKLAMLEQAANQYRAADYDQALESYADFIAANPEHDMASAAEVAIALCHEALGELEQTVDLTKKFLKRNPDSFVAPLATFAQARALAANGNVEEARAVYEDFIAANPDSRWIDEAETALLEINRQIRAIRSS